MALRLDEVEEEDFWEEPGLDRRTADSEGGEAEVAVEPLEPLELPTPSADEAVLGESPPTAMADNRKCNCKEVYVLDSGASVFAQSKGSGPDFSAHLLLVH